MRGTHVRQLSLVGRGKEVGFVITHGKDLLRYGVKTIPGKRGGFGYAQRVERVLGALLAMAGPQVNIIAEDVPETTRVGALRRAVFRTAQKWRREGCTVSLVTLSETKEVLCGDTSATHHELAAAVRARAPEPARLMPRNGYWAKPVLALALVHGATARV